MKQKIHTRIAKFISIAPAIILCWNAVAGQTRIISGVVLDSATRVPLSNVSVCIKNQSKCALSDNNGLFRIAVEGRRHGLTFTYTGYHPYTLILSDSLDGPAAILLSKAYTVMEDIIVRGKRKKYRNKDNPAVELIRQVIANKSKNGPRAYPFTSYQEYEKVRILAEEPSHFITNSWPLKPFRFFFENTDSLTVPGKKLSTVYMQEVVSQNYYQRSPEKNKRLILAKKSVDYGEYIDMKGLSGTIGRLYESINIYDNNISAFTLQFVSPVADFAPTLYMYFIQDTIEEEGTKLIKLYFMPRNPEDLLFQGTLYITLDGNYAIRKLQMEVSKRINLNWIRNFSVSQDFERGPADRYHLAGSDVVAFFSPFARSKGVFGERSITISKLVDSALPGHIFNGPGVDTLAAAYRRGSSFWDEERPAPLSLSEAKAYTNADSLLNMRSYRRLMDYLTLLNIGYKSAGKFDIGPVGSFYSFNPVEGSRLRFGGRSNTKLSSRYFVESYAAYGFADQKWKYFLSGSYSINHQSIYKYPFHYIQASYMRDTRNPGQEDVFAQGNSFLSSFTRGYNSKWLYNDIFRLSYVQETRNHLSFIFGMKYWRQAPAGTLYYIYQPSPGQSDTTKQISISEFSATLRWAPHEQFIENKLYRADIVNKYPIIILQYAKGINGLFGGGYNYDAFHLNIYKRFYLSLLGYTDLTLDAGYLAGTLPFPLLIIPQANQSYFYSYSAYNLMNVEEFVNDHYAGAYIDHYFNGLFFNKIPLFKKLRWREVIAAKILYGGLRNENNPSLNPAQMKLPLTNGALTTFTLGRTPYLEASVGIFNIFSIIRVDLVKRFTYLDHPNISTLGLRFSANFNF